MPRNPVPQVLFLAVLFAGLAAAPLRAQDSPPPFYDSSNEWNWILDEAESYVRGRLQTPAESEARRSLLKLVRGEVSRARKEAEESLEATRLLLDALGPTPKAEEAPEPEDIGAKRRQYADRMAAHRARLARAELAQARIDALEQSISALATERLVERVLEQMPIPLMPEVLTAAVPEFLGILNVLARSPLDWYQGLSEEQRGDLVFWRFALAVLAAALVGWGIRRTVLGRAGPDPAVESPTYARRLLGAVAEGVARGIVPASIVAVFLFWIAGPDAPIHGLFAQVVAGLLKASLFFILAAALPRAVLAPDHPAWRLTELAPENARIVSRRIVLLAAVVAVDLFLQSAAASISFSKELQSVYLLVVTGLEALGILSLTRDRLWRGLDQVTAEDDEAAEGTRDRTPWGTPRRALGVVSVVAVIALLVGYGGIGRFLIEGILGSATVIAGLLLLRGLLHEMVGVMMQSSVLRRRLGVRIRTLHKLKFWGRAALDPLLFLTGLLLVIPWWGVPREDLARWTVQVLRGFTIGSVTISVVDIALAVIAFLGAMAVTRFIQHRLLERVLSETRLDVSVQHSLSAGIGYVGLIVAILLAIVVVGVDLTNIALVAGALSVGIGFGLQNVVSNFVSGMILLVERPIKVGDWVVVGDKEGFVKRINFRATELETWQRASVIIPNAEILSNALINLTHKDRYGRIEIVVGVAYGSNTGKVRDVLLECADGHDEVLAHPEPTVLFQDFGSSSLDFELRCYTANVVNRPRISSELRFEIDRLFRDNGISIPFPQRVVHFAGDAPAPKKSRRRKPPEKGKSEGGGKAR